MARKLKTNTGGQPNLTYLQLRRQLKNKAPHGKQEKEAEKAKDKKEKATFYKEQAAIAPSKCENCGRSLAATIKFHPRAHVCHVVPKTKEGGCPSVAKHPQNKWFGCLDCHTFYDENVAEGNFYEVEQMPVAPELHKRFLSIYPAIAPHERKNIPAFLLDETGKPIMEIKVKKQP